MTGADMGLRSFLRRPAVSFTFKISLSVLALYIVFRRVDLSEVGGILSKSQWILFLPTILLVGVSKVLSSFRLNAFFRVIGLGLTERQNLRLYWLGMYYNLFLPGGIGGDAYKVYLLRKRDGLRTRDLVWAALLDRASGLLVLLIFALLFLLWMPVYPEIRSWMIWILIWVVVAGGWFGMRIFGDKFSKIYLLSLGWSVGVQGIQLLAVLLLLIMTGQSEGYVGFLFLFLLSSILTALPISYGGAGAREITFFYGAGLLGLPEAQAVSISLLFYLASLVVSLSGMRYSFKPLELD